MDRLTKRTPNGVAYMAIADTLPKREQEIEGSKPILEGLYAMFQKLADYEDKEEALKNKIITNADIIRSMTDEELAEWLDKQHNQEREDWEDVGCYHCVNYGTHHQPTDCGDCEWLGGLLQWLRRETK